MLGAECQHTTFAGARLVDWRELNRCRSITSSGATRSEAMNRVTSCQLCVPQSHTLSGHRTRGISLARYWLYHS
eukprot:COSAG01_NODE_3037_length_6685_cov_3.846341_5_plen_74_part_00